MNHHSTSDPHRYSSPRDLLPTTLLTSYDYYLLLITYYLFKQLLLRQPARAIIDSVSDPLFRRDGRILGLFAGEVASADGIVDKSSHTTRSEMF